MTTPAGAVRSCGQCCTNPILSKRADVTKTIEQVEIVLARAATDVIETHFPVRCRYRTG